MQRYELAIQYHKAAREWQCSMPSTDVQPHPAEFEEKVLWLIGWSRTCSWYRSHRAQEMADLRTPAAMCINLCLSVGRRHHFTCSVLSALQHVCWKPQDELLTY